MLRARLYVTFAMRRPGGSVYIMSNCGSSVDGGVGVVQSAAAVVIRSAARRFAGCQTGGCGGEM